jgi:hypothetical protein
MAPRKFLCLLFALPACLAGPSLMGEEPEPISSEWKLVSNSGNVELYRRQRALSNESKAIAEIAAPVEAVQAVIDDVESYSKFMPYTAECRVLKRERSSVLVYQRISAPLTSDRDYTVRVQTSSKPAQEGVTYFIRWETENALGPPEKPGVVRVKLCDGSWLLEPNGPNSTRATYMIYTDSGGAIPAFIKNTGSQIGIRKLFAAVRKQVQDPKYSAAARK